MAYKTSIYLFGGHDSDKLTSKEVTLDCIQEYDTTTQQCVILTQHLPRPQFLSRVVLWDKSAIILNINTCSIFDLDQKTIQRRDQFKYGFDHFGLVLDNQRLYVIGGMKRQRDSNGEKEWTYTDEVKCISVVDIVNNHQTVKWTQHSRIKSPSGIQAYSLMSLSC